MSDNRSESIPMPSPKPPRMPTGSHAEIGDPLDVIAERITRRRVEIEAVGERVDDLAMQLGREPDPKDDDDEGAGIRGRVAMLEAFVGAPANPLRKRVATGAHALFADLGAALDRLTTELSADRSARVEEERRRAEEEKRRETVRAPWSRVAWIAVGAAVGTLTSSAIAGVLFYLAAHWKK